MPWVPELFSAPVLDRLEEKWRRDKVRYVPYFEGLMSGEIGALVGSFAGEPELYDPVRGRVRGERELEAFVAERVAWLADRNVAVEDVEDVERVITERSGFEEVVLHLDTRHGRVDLPVAVVADHESDGRLIELRTYFSLWPLTGRHANRPPLLQPDPDLRLTDAVADYQRALADGDVDAAVGAFEPDGHAREPAGGEHVHHGTGALRAFHERLFADGGGIPLEHCAVVDDGRACALEYNLVKWGRTEPQPQAGVVVYVRGESGKLAAARIYDDVEQRT